MNDDPAFWDAPYLEEDSEDESTVSYKSDDARNDAHESEETRFAEFADSQASGED